MKRLLSILTCAALAPVLTLPALAAETVDTSMAPSGMTMVEDILYVTDTYHRAIWTVEDGRVSLLTGRTEVTDLSGQPVEGCNDGVFDQAAFSEPWAIVAYNDDFLVSDTGNHVLRYLDMDKERVYTAAGTGKAGFRNNTGEKAAFDSPTGLAVDNQGTVYIADTGNNVIRCMDEDGKVTTYAGGEEGCALGNLETVQFSGPTGLCWADGVLYVADTGNHRIVAIADGEAALVAGAELPGEAAYEGGYLNGPAELARFASPQGVAVGADGTVYVADTGNGAVRAIREGYVTTLLSPDPSGTYPISPRSLLCHGNALYMGDDRNSGNGDNGGRQFRFASEKVDYIRRKVICDMLDFGIIILGKEPGPVSDQFFHSAGTSFPDPVISNPVLVQTGNGTVPFR